MSEKSTSVVDANAILSLLLGAEREHFERAQAFFEGVRDGSESAYVPAAVLAECAYVLTRVYRVARSEVAVKLLGLLDYRGLTSEPEARRALELYRDRNVDFVDALVAATAQEQGWKIFSFDRDLLKLNK